MTHLTSVIASLYDAIIEVIRFKINSNSIIIDHNSTIPGAPYLIIVQNKTAVVGCLSGRQFRTTVHDLYISGIAEQPIPFLGSKLSHNTKGYQMAQGLVDCGWTDPGFFH